MNYFYEKELKENPLPVGFIIVEGIQGAGKTSLITALLSLDFKHWGKRRLEWAQYHINDINKQGHRLKLPMHLYWSNTEIALNGSLDKPHTIRTHYINTTNFGLPNPKYKVQRFPWYSVVVITEADLLLYCQDWAKISSYVWNLLKYVRKNRMTVIFDLQDRSALGIQLRRLATDGIYVTASRNVPPRFFGIFRQYTEWWFEWSKPKAIEHESNKTASERKARSSELSWKQKLKYKGNVYTQYDSYAEERYFLQGIDEDGGYTVKEHPPRNYTPEGIKKYCDMLPLTMPKLTNSNESKEKST